MSDRMTAAEQREAREEVLWSLAVDLTRAEEVLESLGMYTATVHIGGRSYGLGQAVRDLCDSVNGILDPEGE